jgi:hypothetical protein
MHRRPVAGRLVTRRVALVAALLLVGTGLSACRENPDVAGYLGSEVITPAQVDEIYDDAVAKYQEQAKLEQDTAAQQAAQAGQPTPSPSPIAARPNSPTRAAVLATILIGKVCTRLQAQEGFAVTPISPDALGQNEHLPNSRYLQERAKTLSCLNSRIGDAAQVDPTDAELLDAYSRAVADGIELDPFDDIKEDLRADETLRRTIAIKREIESISAASDIVINPRYRPAEFPISVLQSGVPVIAAVIGESDTGAVRDAA